MPYNVGEIYSKIAPQGAQSALYQMLNLKRAFQDAQRQAEVEKLKQEREQIFQGRQNDLSRQNQLKLAGIQNEVYTPTNSDIGLPENAANMAQNGEPANYPNLKSGAMSLASGGVGDINGNSIENNSMNPMGSNKIPQGFHSPMGPKTSEKKAEKQLIMKQKQDQFDQRQWSAFVNKNTPTLASSRSTLGMAANGNLRADRALVSIQNNPTMTYQDLGNVVGDLAGIYQGGAPTDMAMKHQQYESIQSQIANLKQYITGKPQNAVPQQVKQKLVDVINNLKTINNDAINRHFEVQEKAQKRLISKFPDEWQSLRQQIQDNYGVNNNSQSSEQSSNQEDPLGIR